MHKTTDLSAGNLNGSDRLVVELITPPNQAAVHRNQLAAQTNRVHTSTV
jgi:hypothetical protein